MKPEAVPTPPWEGEQDPLACYSRQVPLPHAPG
ncbi:hypothetical protein LCGC14_1011120 [marine sediment metagenome]|uniref:Uncharacterized protein n=1 Tax=marine sediment metagenome TaxID=412755 RepID=A0A0F9N0E3_9ZZZZ